MQQTLLALFAHPDDETFRPGGTLALLASMGVRVETLIFTHGEAGSCGYPPLCTLDELPFYREQELRCACAALNIQPPRLLDFADGDLQATNPEIMIGKIHTLINEINAQVLLSFGPDGLSGHADHIAVGQWAVSAYNRVAQLSALYTVAVPHSLVQALGMHQVHAVPDESIALSVDITPVWEAKLAAMRCHGTQWSSAPMAGAPEERCRLFFGQEFFVRAARREAKGDFLPEILRGHLL